MWPAIINSSSVQTAIVIAFAKHGCLTVKELSELLRLEGSHIMKRLCEMRRTGIVTSFAWGGNGFLHGDKKPRNWFIREKRWTLDYRYPLHNKVRALGRALAKGFPLPGDVSGGYRRFRRVRSIDPAPTCPNLYCLGEGLHGRILMMLARRKLPLHTLAKALGCSRELHGWIDSMARHGVIETERPEGARNRHIIMMNRQFCAYFGLLYLAWAIDNATGREFVSLSISRRLAIGVKALAKVNAKRAQRRAQGKPYFQAPHPFHNSPAASRSFDKVNAERAKRRAEGQSYFLSHPLHKRSASDR
jgi:hypothetical protein